MTSPMSSAQDAPVIHSNGPMAIPKTKNNNTGKDGVGTSKTCSCIGRG